MKNVSFSTSGLLTVELELNCERAGEQFNFIVEKLKEMNVNVCGKLVFCVKEDEVRSENRVFRIILYIPVDRKPELMDGYRYVSNLRIEEAFCIDCYGGFDSVCEGLVYLNDYVVRMNISHVLEPYFVIEQSDGINSRLRLYAGVVNSDDKL